MKCGWLTWWFLILVASPLMQFYGDGQDAKTVRSTALLKVEESLWCWALQHLFSTSQVVGAAASAWCLGMAPFQINVVNMVSESRGGSICQPPPTPTVHFRFPWQCRTVLPLCWKPLLRKILSPFLLFHHIPFLYKRVGLVQFPVILDPLSCAFGWVRFSLHCCDPCWSRSSSGLRGSG